MPEFDISLYDDEFFQWHVTHARKYSMRTMDWYIQKYRPDSVVDFGCGIGSYLESAYDYDIKIKGYEISLDAFRYTPEFIRPYIEYRDCTEVINCGIFDTVISFETAEHIEPEGTNQFILNLVNATGKTLLFTAAPPGQEGTGHINCRTRDFWMMELSDLLIYNDILTGEISEAWEKLGAPWYIVKNLMVFSR